MVTYSPTAPDHTESQVIMTPKIRVKKKEREYGLVRRGEKEKVEELSRFIKRWKRKSR